MLPMEHLAWALQACEGVAREFSHRSHHDPEDMRQEALLGYLRCCPLYRPGEGDFRTYARAKMRFAVIDHLRAIDHLSRQDRCLLKATPAGEIAHRADGSPILRPVPLAEEMDAAVELPMRDPIFRGEIRRLPYRERLIVFFVYWLDLSQEEVGSLLLLSPARVSQLCARAEQKLAPLLDPVAA